MWKSWFTSSILPGTSKEDARTSHGPVISNLISASSPSIKLIGISFIFKRISITSSLIPSMVLYSCEIPSIATSVTAAPGIEDNKILLSAFPSVWPKPLSKGSNVTLDNVGDISSTCISVGTNRSITDVCIIFSAFMFLFWVKLNNKIFVNFCA